MHGSEIDRAVVDISKLLAENRLVHNIATTLPLSDIVRAHETVEQGAVAGKVVLQIS